MALATFWIFTPLTGTIIFAALIHVYLSQERSYNVAPHPYIASLLAFMFLNVLMVPRDWPLRNASPYALTFFAREEGRKRALALPPR